jgi:hypothetical protein
MAAVLTTSMTLRIILSVRGTLDNGGSFALSASSGLSGSSRTTHVISTRSGVQTHLSIHNPTHTYTLDDMRGKPEGEFDIDGKSSVNEPKTATLYEGPAIEERRLGVKVTVNKDVDYDTSARAI